MSHLIQLNDVKLSKEAVYEALKHKEFEGWQRQEMGGILSLHPAGWLAGRINIAADGSLSYDNYDGHWGDAALVEKLAACSLAIEAGFSLDGMSVSVEADEHVYLFA